MSNFIADNKEKSALETQLLALFLNIYKNFSIFVTTKLEFTLFLFKPSFYLNLYFVCKFYYIYQAKYYTVSMLLTYLQCLIDLTVPMACLHTNSVNSVLFSFCYMKNR